MNFWANQTALVLGAAGFCGAHLCDQLTQKGAQVIGFDRFLPPDSWLHSSARSPKCIS
jgi:nucleoside-diphosphate-sugar epimerase